jgi:hypothetical protein
MRKIRGTFCIDLEIRRRVVSMPRDLLDCIYHSYALPGVVYGLNLTDKVDLIRIYITPAQRRGLGRSASHVMFNLSLRTGHENGRLLPLFCAAFPHSSPKQSLATLTVYDIHVT